MTAAGIDAQIGFADETTYGTYVAPTRFYEFVSETVKFNVARLQSAGIRPGRRLQHRWKPGAKSVSGNVIMELVPQDLAFLWKNIAGNPVTTGTDPYTHTFAGLGDIDSKSVTMQIGRPDETGVVRAFSYTGVKFPQAKIQAAINEYAMLDLSVYGRDETTAQPLASATYDAEHNPFVFTEGSLSVASSDVPVTAVDMSFDLKLGVDRHRITGTVGDVARPRKALVNGVADVTGSFTADFSSLTAYNRYVNGTEAQLVLVFNAAADAQMTITANVRFDGETPNVSGPTLLTQPIKYAVTSGTSDANAITVAIVNSDATP